MNYSRKCCQRNAVIQNWSTLSDQIIQQCCGINNMFAYCYKKHKSSGEKIWNHCIIENLLSSSSKTWTSQSPEYNTKVLLHCKAHSKYIKMTKMWFIISDWWYRKIKISCDVILIEYEVQCILCRKHVLCSVLRLQYYSTVSWRFIVVRKWDICI